MTNIDAIGELKKIKESIEKLESKLSRHESFRWFFLQLRDSLLNDPKVSNKIKDSVCECIRYIDTRFPLALDGCALGKFYEKYKSKNPIDRSYLKGDDDIFPWSKELREWRID